MLRDLHFNTSIHKHKIEVVACGYAGALILRTSTSTLQHLSTSTHKHNLKSLLNFLLNLAERVTKRVNLFFQCDLKDLSGQVNAFGITVHL